MKRILISFGIGCALAAADLILCFLRKDWNLSFYAIILGAIGVFASALSLWSPVGATKRNMYERRVLQMYSGSPEAARKSVKKEKKIELSASLTILSFALPVLVIPILTDVIRHVP